MTRRVVPGFLLALAGPLLSGCTKSTWSYRYRLTLYVDTPEGVKTGAGVIEIQSARALFDLNQMPLAWRMYGEAVVVDLGARGLLFALLDAGEPRPNLLGMGRQVFERTGALKARETPEERESKLERLRASAELKRDEIPVLVLFRDIEKPTTVEEVDPDDLAKSFGAGTKLTRVTIETTTDPVTTGVEKTLKRLPLLHEGLTRDINDGSFWQGINR